MKPFEFVNIDQFLDDFKTIVNIDSSSDYLPGVEKVARFFQHRFSAIGLSTTLCYLGADKIPCLEAKTFGRESGFDVMLLGHMDTVFPFGEVEKRPFQVQGDRALGPGVCDMKGGLLVVLHTLETLKAAGVLDRLSVLVALNGDEETGSWASRDWIMSNADRSKKVLVFEPCRPGRNLVIRRKGGGWFKVTVKGREAHAGADPHQGANAVLELAHQVLEIDKLGSPETGTTAQVTVFHGGDKVNIIPSLASASVDVRIERADEKERVESFFKALPGKTVLKGTQILVEGNVDRPPLEASQSSLAILDLFVAQGKKLGLTVGAIDTGGCSDGNFTSARGVPTIDGLGLIGANAHRPDEYVELSSIPDMVNLVSGVCASFVA